MVFLIQPDASQLHKAFRFSQKLLSLGYGCVMDRREADGDVPPGVKLLSSVECGEVCDCIVSVGGDGTMLKVSQRAITLDKPLFGLNAGRIGFLCAFDFEQIDLIRAEDIESLKLSERMLLEVTVSEDPGNSYLAVNDVVLSRGGLSQTIEFKVFCGERAVGDYRADGVIISTPTGSTGYALSAGGPIIEPALDVVLVTPVCPHAMFSRSIVFGGDEEIRVKPSDRRDAGVYLSVDSSHTFLLENCEEISVIKSRKTLKLMTSSGRDYFEMLGKRIRGR